MALDRTTPVYDPNVYGEPDYNETSFDLDVYGDLYDAGGGTDANAGAATGTGTAGAASAEVDPNAGQASGSGSAFDATVSTGAAADAGFAAGTGAASAASVEVAPNAGVATGTGSANTPAASVSGSPSAATGTGAAGAPSPEVAPNAGLASGSGSAFDATVSTGADVNVDAGLASGTGSAFNATVNIQPNASLASGTGSAFGVDASIGVSPRVAAGRGTAYWPLVFDPEIRIYIDGTDYAPSVLYSSARFLSQVNGATGDCYVRLRDPDRTIDLPTGAPILLTIGGEPVWRGFISQWERKYVFPAIDIDAFGETRFFDIQGADINVLFQKRIVFNQATPTVVAGKLYPPFQPDNEVIADLVADYLDLSSDTIDTSTFVDNVGEINEDQEGRAWSAGDSWGQAMQSIAMLPAAIFYLRPTIPGADLVYCDVDTADAPYPMSDLPNQGSGGQDVTTLIDDFDRVEVDGWGTGNLGAWGGGSDPIYSTDGTHALVTNASFSSRRVTLPAAIEATTDEWVFEQKFTWTSTTSNGDYLILFQFFSTNTFRFQGYIQLTRPSLTLTVVVDGLTSDSEVLSTGVAPSGDAHLKVSYSPVTGVLRARYWLDVDPEPSTWQVQAVAVSSSGWTATRRVLVVSNAPVSTTDWRWDYVRMDGITNLPGGDSATYREMEIMLDGSSLVNDQLAWGMGYGSQDPVFVREEDATSQAEHGLWQAGTVRYGIYKQGTIDRVAESIVYGSPQSKRGAKDDKVSVGLTTYTPGFLVGQKVDFTSEVWDFTDVIPIRKMEVTFELPDPIIELGASGTPRYRLTLSHEIDAPWGFIDQYLPTFAFPLPPFPPFPSLPPWTTASCGGEDDFYREVESGWGGDEDSGYSWTTTVPHPEPPITGYEQQAYVDQFAGHMLGYGHGTSNSDAVRSDTPISFEDQTIEFEFAINHGQVTGGSQPRSGMDVILGTSGNDEININARQVIDTSGTPTPFHGIAIFQTGGAADSDVAAGLFLENTRYQVKAEISLTNSIARAKLWLASSDEPAGWNVSISLSSVDTWDRLRVVHDVTNTIFTDPRSHLQVFRFYISEFNLCPNPLDGPGTPQSIGIDLSGFGCEVPTRVDDTTYQCTAAFVAGSSRVWINGLFQRRGTEYTETPETGTIVFGASVAETSIVQVCYQSAGALGEGA